MKKIVIKRMDVIRYAAEFLCFILFSNAEIVGGSAPFHAGFFVALLYCKENIFAITPMYIVSILLFRFNLADILTALALPVVFAVAALIHNRMKRPIKLIPANLYGFIAQIPFLTVSILLDGNLTAALVTVFGGQVFIMCAMVILYAIFVRGLRYRFSADELASLGIMIMGLSLGLYRFNISGVRPFYVIAPFIVLAAIWCLKEKGVIAAILIGLGASLANADFAPTASFALMGILAFSFRSASVYLSAAALCIGEVIAAYFFGVYGDYNFIQLILVGIGALLFALLPAKVRRKMADFSKSAGDKYAGKSIVNSARHDLKERLQAVAEAYCDMGSVIEREALALPDKRECVDLFAAQLKERLCANCPKKECCREETGGKLTELYGELVEDSIARGKATKLDVPNYFVRKCDKLNGLVEEMNAVLKRYDALKKSTDFKDRERAELAEQLKAVSDVFRNLQTEFDKKVSFDSETEKKIVDELAYKNVVVLDIIVYGKNRSDVKISLIVRAGDKDKRIIEKVISAVMKLRMRVEKEKTKVKGNLAFLSLSLSPKFNLAYGEACLKKEGSLRSGDTKGVTKLSGDKVLAAICDGMGSGEDAERESATAIGIVENCYRAGLSPQLILPLTNSLLALKKEESYSCLDLAVFDLKNGECDLIKMGARESVLKRGESTEIIKMPSPPAGILEEARPEQQKVYLSAGDMLILLSDGVCDAIGAEGAASVAERLSGRNPQELADAILQEAEKEGKADDMTVLCLRLYERVS